MSTIDKVLIDNDKVASNSKEIAADLKEILSSLKKVMENGEEIQPGDKRLFSLLLKNLRTKVQIEIFNKLLDNNPDYASLSETLAAKINEFKKELSAVVEKNNKTLKYSSSQERVLERLIKSLEDAKKDLDDKNVINASTRLLENYNIQEIIDNCSTSLALGYMDFYPFFGTDMIKSSKQSVHSDYNVDFKTLDKVIEVIREDESVRKEIIEYYNSVKSCDKEKSILEKNEGLLHLLQAVAPYVSRIIEVYQNSSVLAEKEKDKNALIEEKDIIIPREKKRLQNNLVSSLLNSREINVLNKKLFFVNQDLKVVNAEIDKINQANDSLIKQILEDAKANNPEDMEVIKRVVNLKDYVANVMESTNYRLPHEYGDETIDCDWILRLLVDILMGNKTFDSALERMDKLVKNSQKALTKKENKKIAAYETLSDKARLYADSDIYSARACVGILERDPRYDRTPAICAFILHILGQSKKIAFDDLLEVVNLAGNVDIPKIEEEYNSIINRHVDDITRLNASSIRDYEKLYRSEEALDTEVQMDQEDIVSEETTENKKDLVQDSSELEPTIFEQEEYSPYVTPQMGDAAYAKRVEVVDQYLEEKFGYSRSSQYKKNQENDDRTKLL